MVMEIVNVLQEPQLYIQDIPMIQLFMEQQEEQLALPIIM